MDTILRQPSTFAGGVDARDPMIARIVARNDDTVHEIVTTLKDVLRTWSEARVSKGTGRIRSEAMACGRGT